MISPDVGGGFGVKGNFAVEVSTVVWAAQLLRRPVKWTATRTETFLSDAQARDHDTTARMGFDRDGRIVAMQIDTLAALGGYLSNFAPSIPGNSYPQTVTGLYKTPNLHLRVRGVYTNTVPVDAYRGSGRPEATWTNERLIERGARELGIDVVEMRRRNLIARADFPYPAPGGRVYDSGDPPALLDKLLAAADYAALRREQAELRRSGVLMGIGLAAFIDKAGTGPSANLAKRGGLHGGWESAIVRVHSDGKVTIFCRQSFARAGPRDHVLPDRGRPPRACRSTTSALVEGDTDQVPFGNGTWGARSTSVAGTAIYRAADKVLDKARRFAAQALECAAGDIDYRRVACSRARHRSVDRLRGGRRPRLSRRAAAGRRLAPGLEVTEFYDPPDTNDPQAMHLAVVVVDPDTGAVRLRDALCRRRLRRGDQSDDRRGPGARRPGAGHRPGAHGTHRLRSRIRAAPDRELSRLRACRAPPICPRSAPPSSRRRRRAIRSASRAQARAATIGAPAAIGNAVIDALWHLGVRDISLPITSETVWRAFARKRLHRSENWCLAMIVRRPVALPHGERERPRSWRQHERARSRANDRERQAV